MILAEGVHNAFVNYFRSHRFPLPLITCERFKLRTPDLVSPAHYELHFHLLVGGFHFQINGKPLFSWIDL
jgi:hypothetical protein